MAGKCKGDATTTTTTTTSYRMNTAGEQETRNQDPKSQM